MSEQTAAKVTGAHLARTAYLYVRQSTLRQVLTNAPSACTYGQKSAIRTKAAETEVLVHPTCTVQWYAGHPRSTMRQTTRERLDLNMPLTSRNILVEMVARAGIEPATFRFSGGRSYQLSYLAGRHRCASPWWRP